MYAMPNIKQRSSIVMFLHDLCYTLVVDLMVQSSQLVWQAFEKKNQGIEAVMMIHLSRSYNTKETIY
jgi:hypothetical protein